MKEPTLSDRRILVVEDEYLIADELRRELETAGAIPVGPVPSVEMALDLVQNEPPLDAGILDVNLGTERSFPIAAALQERRIPFIFATGYNAGDIPAEWRHVPHLEKPVSIESVREILDRLFGV